MEKSDEIAKEINEFLRLFEDMEKKDDLRNRVKALIPVFDRLRELGKSLVPDGLSLSARDRLLKYFLSYPGTVLHERELAIVAGISE